MLKQKKTIEQAYQYGESLGVSVWCEDEAGPYQTKPYDGASWQPVAHPAHLPHEYIRNGTAKLLTLFRPATGQVRMKGVMSATNAVLHDWLKQELTDILAHLPKPAPVTDQQVNRAFWERWRKKVRTKHSLLSAALPPLRMLLILDNLVGHKTPELVLWCFRHGILPIYTPVAGSWLNMAESLQRIFKRRALDGTYPGSAYAIIRAFESVAAHWNLHPTPFVWAGKRKARRDRAALKRHLLGASGAAIVRPSRSRFLTRWSWQVTH